jgi:hypothetical protein
MPTQNSPRFERVFIQQQSTLRTIPNSAGTWTNTGAKLLRYVGRLGLSGGAALIQIPWKTGTRSTQPGILGRRGASFSCSNLPVVPSGTAGTAPDMAAIFEGITGLAGSVSAGVSVTYNFSDTAFLPFTLFSFQHGLSAQTQRLAWGCIPEEASFNFNGNVFDMSVSGSGGYLLDSDNFASEDSTGKAGLTAYPVEPASPTSVGSIITGFSGTATFAGTAMTASTAAMKSCGVRVRTGSRVLNDVFGDAYGALTVGGERSVSINCSFVDNDAAALIVLKNNAKNKTVFDVTLTVGTVAGYIVDFVMKQFQFAVADFSDEADHVVVSFGESMGHASAIGSIDDVSIVFR